MPGSSYLVDTNILLRLVQRTAPNMEPFGNVRIVSFASANWQKKMA